MGRGRVQMKKIENKINRQVTFSKRRGGLIKKAHEISVLCDADVALIVFSNRGKLFHYSSDACMEKILERYERYSYAERQIDSNNTSSEGHWTFEYAKLKARIGLLDKNHRHYMGNDLDEMSMKEIQCMEQQMDVALKRIRARKNQIMNESISELQKKGKEIQEQNNMLVKKIKENEKSRAQNQVQLQQQNQNNPHECSSQGDEVRRTSELELTLEPGYSSQIGCLGDCNARDALN